MLFAVGFRYALRSIHESATYLAVLAIPFIFSYVFYMGFYNFCYSTAVFVWVLGYWFRWREEDFSWRRVAVQATLVLWMAS